METTIELPNATDLRFSYVQGISRHPHLWGVGEDNSICFNKRPIFCAVFDQRVIYRHVRLEENIYEQQQVG